MVTVICVCFNQAPFVAEAILSVMRQTYQPVQLVVVDDGSNDDSVEAINECIDRYPQIIFLRLTENNGYCRAFNQALKHATGEYIIDFAADDVLLPDRIKEGITALTQAGERYGVHFSDADWISEDGSLVYRHSRRFPHHSIPQGDVYKDLVERFFICSPTMMFRRKVIDSLGGYDESLEYEDFDFWIRSSRSFMYCYTPEVLVKKRIVSNSMSQKQFKIFSPQLPSTFKVCEKILALNRTAAEQKALSRRILYEMRVSLRLLHIPLVWKYARLYLKNMRRRYDHRD